MDNSGTPGSSPAMAAAVPLANKRATTNYSDLEVYVRNSIIKEKYPEQEKYPVVQGEDNSPVKDRAASEAVSPVSARPGTEMSPAYQATDPNPTVRAPTVSNEDAWSAYDPKSEMAQKPVGRFGFIKQNKKKLAIGAAALVLLIIILSVSLGVTVGRQRSNSSPVAGKPVPIFEDTNLAAVNWTDANGDLRKAVLYQDNQQSLMLAIFSTQRKQWNLTDISSSLRRVNASMAVDVKKGSALALAAAFPNGSPIIQLSAYFLSSDNRIREIVNPNPTNPESEWFYGLLTWEQHLTSPGSHLATFWQTCPACTNSLLLTFQAPEGTIELLNFTNSWPAPVTISPRSAANAGMAISPFVDFRGKGPTGTLPTAWRMYYVDSAELFELINGPETSFRWEAGNFNDPITASFSVRSAPDLASITYGANGWINNLVTALSSNGTISSYRWQGTTWESAVPTFEGGPEPMLGTIATSQAMKLYGTMNGRIEEWETTVGNPFKWTYVGPITL